MKLYEVPHNTMIDVSHLDLVDEITGEKVETVDFRHVDGMYSLCYWNGKELHLSSSTEVKILDQRLKFWVRQNNRIMSNLIFEKNKPWEDDAYGYETWSKGDCIFVTLRKIIDNPPEKLSGTIWAYDSFMDCADLLTARKRWPDELNHPRDAKNRLQWWCSRLLYKLNITKNVMYGPQKRMSRDPFIMFYTACVILDRKQFIEVVRIPWHINRPDMWLWRRRLLKDNRKDFVRRLDYYKSLANVRDYERQRGN